MKRIIIYLFYISMTISLYSQQEDAIIKKTKGIIISKYLKNNFGSFCEMETLLLYNRDTLVFFQNSNKNISILKCNPHLEKKIGRANSFYSDYLYESSKGLYDHDLTISKYNYHNKNFGTILVESSTFFTDRSPNYLYSIYQFSGEVVLYSGLFPYDRSEIMTDCNCPKLQSRDLKFAVLKKTYNLRPLTLSQIRRMKLTNSDLNAIKVFYCE